MRKAMQTAVKHLLHADKNTALLLVDIGAWPFHELLEELPQRAKNIGIFEPGTISAAAGLSLMGITPIVYGISPFLVQRSLEQLKLDFVYQKTGGNFITTGASYDFSTLGYSHYCPEDIATLSQLPGMDILAPATPAQFLSLWDACALNGRPSYFRLTDHCAVSNPPAQYGKASVIKRGTKGLVLTAAEMLDPVLAACADRDVSILHYATLQPFDEQTLRELYHERIFICHPFYEGTTAPFVTRALAGMPFRLKELGVPMQVLRSYGTKQEKDSALGLTVEAIASHLEAFLKE